MRNIVLQDAFLTILKVQGLQAGFDHFERKPYHLCCQNRTEKIVKGLKQVTMVFGML
jgi:hypothetical protein